MARLKRDMEQYKVPDVYKKIFFACPDSIDLAWSIREFIIDKAREAVAENEIPKNRWQINLVIK